MLTINGVPTEIYQDVVIRGDLTVDGEIDSTNQSEVTWEQDVVCFEGDVVTYTN